MSVEPPSVLLFNMALSVSLSLKLNVPEDSLLVDLVNKPDCNFDSCIFLSIAESQKFIVKPIDYVNMLDENLPGLFSTICSFKIYRGKIIKICSASIHRFRADLSNKALSKEVQTLL